MCSAIVLLVAFASCTAASENNEKVSLNAILMKAADWSTDLNVDPLRIQNELKMKGVKHFVEYVSLLDEVIRYGNTTVSSRARKQMAAAHSITTKEPYHKNVADASVAPDPRRFRADSISYLRAMTVFKSFGLDTSLYRQRLLDVLPRIQAQIEKRGIIQKLAFALLFDLLGLAPHPHANMEAAFGRSTIASRKPLDWFLQRVTPSRIYLFTHEVFETTNVGQVKFRFGEPERLHGIEIARQLLANKMASMNSQRERALDLDHHCELVMSMTAMIGLPDRASGQKILKPQDSTLLGEAVEAILKRRNAEDGNFGLLFTPQYEQLNKNHWSNEHYDMRIGAMLHCTSVCIRALTMVSHFPSLRERFFSDGGALQTVSVAATGETQPLPPAAHPGVVERVAHTSSILGDTDPGSPIAKPDEWDTSDHGKNEFDLLAFDKRTDKEKKAEGTLKEIETIVAMFEAGQMTFGAREHKQRLRHFSLPSERLTAIVAAIKRTSPEYL